MSTDHSRSTTTSATVNAAFTAAETFSAVHPDIVDAHILTKLDGPTLASISSVSTLFQSLCVNENLWRNICDATWPSIKDPRVRDAISVFPSGYRSFFSNSFSSLHHHKVHRDRLPTTTELISAVDIHYKGQPVYSKVKVTNTLAEGFSSWPTWVDSINPIEEMATSVKFGVSGEGFMSHVIEHVTLSWIIFDPTRKLVANLSSLRPVLVEPHWLNGHVHVRYATLLTTDDSSVEGLEFRISVTCEVKKEGGMNVKELNLEGLNMNGKAMKWKDSLVILQEAMESRRGERWKERGKERERYDEYLNLRREKRMKEEGKEMGPLGLKIVGILCMFFFYFAFFLWVFMCVFNRYILRRKLR